MPQTVLPCVRACVRVQNRVCISAESAGQPAAHILALAVMYDYGVCLTAL